MDSADAVATQVAGSDSRSEGGVVRIDELDVQRAWTSGIERTAEVRCAETTGET